MLETEATRLLKRELKIIPKTLNRSHKDCKGYSLIELIVVLAGISLLTSLAITRFNSYFKYLDLDQTFAHVNEISAQCLNDLNKNNSSTNIDISSKPTAAVYNQALLDKNFFDISGSHNKCHYFELKPKTAGEENDLRFGFGIYKGRVTKFAISNDKSMDTDCERWAGDRYCIKNASSTTTSGFDKYFSHMEKVRRARIKCEQRFETKLASESEFNRWNYTAESNCPLDAKENSDNSYKTSTCKSSGCNKKAYIFDGKFVGYSQSDYTASTSAACSNSLDTYLAGLSETAAPEIKSDLENCDKKTFYICNTQLQASETEWKACKIKQEVTACEIELDEEAAKDSTADENREYTVTGQGLPPCGVRYTICNKGVYNSPTDSPCTVD